MRLLEYQAKEIFKLYGMPVGPGQVCRNVAEVEAALQVIDFPLVLKSQVPSGKRGKGGGIKFASDRDTALAMASDLFKSNVCGYAVKELLLEQLYAIQKEYYAGVITDGSSHRCCPVMLFSASGGMEIEELVAENPDAIIELPVDPLFGPADYQLRDMLNRAGVSLAQRAELVKILQALYRVYWDYDAELAEINPLGVTESGNLIVMDAKLTVDSSAAFRHPGLKETFSDTREARAAALGLSYVDLDGNIGIISNGAGLTMATMDQLAQVGGQPANFMDAGERILHNGIADGFSILEERKELKAVFINVFGGGVQCDQIAQKINDYLISQGAAYPLPVLICLQGRNAEVARQIIKEQGHPAIRLLDTMEEAVIEAAALGGLK